MKSKILIILDPSRYDTYSYLKDNAKVNDYYLLSLTSLPIELEEIDFDFVSINFWNDFKSPQEIIDYFKPNKIIFFEIIDTLQISLIITANHYKIKTIYLEHGAAGDAKISLERSFNKINFKVYTKKIILNVKNIKRFFKNKIFFLKSYKYVTNKKSKISFIKFFLSFLNFNKPLLNLKKNYFPERIPNISIVFNRVNYEEYKLYTNLSEDKAKFTGVPFYDHFFKLDTQLKDHIIFIDHPYYENKLYGWDKEFHFKIMKTLYDFCNNKKITIFIKLHPQSNRKILESYLLENEYFKIIQEGDFTNLYLESKLIFGYSSSLLNGLICSKKNVVNIGWHPSPRIIGSDFSKTGLCHKSLDINEIFEKYDSWLLNNLSDINKKKYDLFLKEFNDPFDGKATERICDILNND
jgi:hypothetical protein